MKIGFIFVTVFEKKSLKLGGKRSSQEIEKDESKEEQSEVKKRLKRADTPAEVQQLKCSFCLEVMYKPVSLLPCLHNFCGGWYADWMVKRNECPECRDKVKQIKRNHMINSMIEQYLKKNPDQEKSKEIKDDQDEKDWFDNNVVTYQNAKKLKKEHDEKVAEDKKNNKNKKPEPKDKDKEANAKEEEKEEDKEEDKKENKEEEKKKEEEKQPVRKPPNKREWRNWDKAINGFQWSNDTRHVVCSAWKQVFPISGKPGINIQWIWWRQYFWHQHWNCKNHARNKVSILHMLPFAGITANSLFKNQYEQRVLKDYIKFKGFSVIQFRDNMLNKCDAAADWEINDALGGTQILAKNSSVWMNWANDVWERVIYWYREAIHNELPQNVKSRSDWWYGFECRTQIHNFSHASRLNHICKPSK